MIFIYPAIIHEGYWAEFPDLDGAYTQGDTLNDVVFNLEESLTGYLMSLLDREVDIPKATEPNKIKLEDGDLLTLVKVDVDINKLKKSVKKTLTIPYWLEK